MSREDMQERLNRFRAENEKSMNNNVRNNSNNSNENNNYNNNNSRASNNGNNVRTSTNNNRGELLFSRNLGLTHTNQPRSVARDDLSFSGANNNRINNPSNNNTNYSNKWRQFAITNRSSRNKKDSKDHLNEHLQKDMNVFSLSQFGESAERCENKDKLAAALAIRNTDNVQEKFRITTDKLMEEQTSSEKDWIPDTQPVLKGAASDKTTLYQRHKNVESYEMPTSSPDELKHDLPFENFPSHPDSLHRALKPVLILARCFALIPVEGISAPNASYLTFPSVYLGSVIGYSLLIALLSVLKTVQFGLSYYSTVDFVFVTSSMVIYLLFLQLATSWPKTMCLWEKAERGMRHYGYPRRMALKFRCILFIMMALAIIEHVASIVTAVFEALPCSNGGTDIIRAYFVIKFRQVFSFVHFNLFIAIPVLIMNLILTCAWNFMDVFIILMSLAMAERYKQVNERLNSVKCKVLPTSFWRHIRETYNTLSCLTKLLDNLLSPIVLLSFASNLYFICLQLLNSLRPMQSTWQATYFVYSFSYLLVRTIAVSLSAASVHDQSKEPKSVLFSVPTESYCVEVSRFLIQVTNDDLALTGCKFFAVTRTFMLTVAGTIVTYEIVLVQFNAVSSEDAAAAKNSSIICPE